MKTFILKNASIAALLMMSSEDSVQAIKMK